MARWSRDGGASCANLSSHEAFLDERARCIDVWRGVWRRHGGGLRVAFRRRCGQRRRNSGDDGPPTSPCGQLGPLAEADPGRRTSGVDRGRCRRVRLTADHRAAGGHGFGANRCVLLARRSSDDLLGVGPLLLPQLQRDPRRLLRDRCMSLRSHRMRRTRRLRVGQRLLRRKDHRSERRRPRVRRRMSKRQRVPL